MMPNDLDKTRYNQRRRSMEDTQPSFRVLAENGESSSPPSPKKRRPFLLLSFLALMAMLCVIFISGALGKYQGEIDYKSQATATSFSYLRTQLELALEDIEKENYYVALQRLDYIFETDPIHFAMAKDLHSQVSAIVNVTETPTPVPSATLSPTPDMRPADEQFANAKQAMANYDWEKTLEFCLNLRKTNPGYHVTEIDQMVYVSLRMLGIEKIIDEGKFESGIYDFALAQQYGVLDFYSVNLGVWANYYLMGNSFWLAYPEIAASYYGQVAGAMPHLTDETGSTAFYRYWMSLVHIAQQLVDDEEWCEGSSAYQTALNAAGSAQYAPTATFVWDQCVALTPTVTPTPTLTMTMTPTIDLTGTVTATFTPTFTATVTPEQSETPTIEGTPSETPTFTATVEVNETDTPVPADTDTPVPVDTDTPVPVDTDTPVPPPPPEDTDTPTPTSTATDTPEAPSATVLNKAMKSGREEGETL